MVDEVKPEKKESSGKPSWMKMKQADLEKIVVELAKEGNSAAQIGLVLRDKYGVPKAKLLGVKISKILEKAGVEFKNEEKIIRGNVEVLKTHFGKNKHDYSAQRALTKRLWIINRFDKEIS